MRLSEYPGHDDMNRSTRRIVLSIYVLVLSVSVNGRMLSLRAPELFGDARAYVAQSGRGLYGLIYAPGAAFVFRGDLGDRDLSCSITQIAGQPIDQADGPVPCYAVQRGGRWIGWIQFRGGQRAFCGAASIDELPQICRLRK